MHSSVHLTCALAVAPETAVMNESLLDHSHSSSVPQAALEHSEARASELESALGTACQRADSAAAALEQLREDLTRSQASSASAAASAAQAEERCAEVQARLDQALEECRQGEARSAGVMQDAEQRYGEEGLGQGFGFGFRGARRGSCM